MSSPKKMRVDLNVSDVDDEYESATVHGIMTEVSPVKSSSSNPKVKYFTGKMSDGSKTVRVISFDPALRPRFAKASRTARQSPFLTARCSRRNRKPPIVRTSWWRPQRNAVW